MKHIQIIGAGLAGSEAAWQAAEAGCRVDLFEMRPRRMTQAHKTGWCAELVCSNSFRGADLTNAVGLLKEELRVLRSLVLWAADRAQVPAGGALAVDREMFSRLVHERLLSHPNITLQTREITDIPSSSVEAPVIIATGPLTSQALAEAIQTLVGRKSLAFFDAISPILLRDSIDESKMFRQSRYDKGTGCDYLNIPLNRGEYYAFVDAIRSGEKYSAHSDLDETLLCPFEGCLPIEEMVERGPDTLRFGPLKPVGLTDLRTGMRPYAVIQLRQDDRTGALWSMVGMQTRLKHGEQLRIFRSLPGLEQAEFARLGSVHRNTFIDSPRCLDPTRAFRGRSGLFFAGQITGVEGYVESAAGGLVAGLNAGRLLCGLEPVSFPLDTAIGSLMAYISDPARRDFQPMNVSYGLMPSYHEQPHRAPNTVKISKRERRLLTARRALSSLQAFIKEHRLRGTSRALSPGDHPSEVALTSLRP